MKPIHCILAVDQSNAIAKVKNDGTTFIPWKIKEDLDYFKKITMSTFDENKINAIVMGRVTYQMIPDKFKPLSGRLNVVISSKSFDNMDEKNKVVTFNSPQNAINTLNLMDNIESIYICGGVGLYEYFLNEYSNMITYIYLNRIIYNCLDDNDLCVKFNLYDFILLN